MKTTANLTSQGPVDRVSVKGNATTSPLQLKVADGEGGLLQMKESPIQMAGDEDEELLQKKENPLQLKHIGDNPLKPIVNTCNPLQQIATIPVQKRRTKPGCFLRCSGVLCAEY